MLNNKVIVSSNPEKGYFWVKIIIFIENQHNILKKINIM